MRLCDNKVVKEPTNKQKQKTVGKIELINKDINKDISMNLEIVEQQLTQFNDIKKVHKLKKVCK